VSVVLPVGDGPAQDRGLIGDHDSAGDIVVEREHGDGGLADGEGRRGDHGREKPLEPFPRLGQFGRNARSAWMDLGADMVGDEPDDAFAIGR
jgi:hypothetical protein